MKPARILLLVLLAAGIFIPVKLFLFETIYIASGSMEPTLSTGENYFVDKITLRLRRPRRGEIVSLKSPEDPGIEVVKRIIALGGDTVRLKDKKVFLNGQELFEPYTQYVRKYDRLKGDSTEDISIPEGSVFLLGDNRDESNDCLSWKDPATGARILYVPESSITGKVRGGFAEQADPKPIITGKNDDNPREPQ